MKPGISTPATPISRSDTSQKHHCSACLFLDNRHRIIHSEILFAGAIIYLPHSGGKDSQAMYNYIAAQAPDDQISVIHANLGAVEWHGIQEHIRNNIHHELNVVQANKTLLDMVRRRARTRPDVPPWPSPKYRQCTSDLKRNPIMKFIRHDMKRRGLTRAINAIGLRAEESARRAAALPWRLNKRLSVAGRTVHEWLPIHAWTEPQVFAFIASHNQKPFHGYIAKNGFRGNSRISCVFCIMGCKSDLQNGHRERPELYQEYLDVEEETGWTMFPNESLAGRIGKRSAPLTPTVFSNSGMSLK